jgi:hypothetical protein
MSDSAKKYLFAPDFCRFAGFALAGGSRAELIR